MNFQYVPGLSPTPLHSTLPLLSLTRCWVGGRLHKCHSAPTWLMINTTRCQNQKLWSLFAIILRNLLFRLLDKASSESQASREFNSIHHLLDLIRWMDAPFLDLHHSNLIYMFSPRIIPDKYYIYLEVLP